MLKMGNHIGCLFCFCLKSFMFVQKIKTMNSFIRNYKFIIILNTISIILSGIAIWLNINSLTIESSNLIITFIGILATFIVIVNFTQFANLQEKDGQINDLQSEIYRLCGSLYSDMLLLKDNKISDPIKYYKACDLLLEYYSKEKNRETFEYLMILEDFKIQFDDTISDYYLTELKTKFEKNGFNPVSLSKYLESKK